MTDDETWVDGDHANTLNRFDMGDTRTTHIVVEAETFSVYPEGGNGADIAAAKVECSPALTKVKSERGVHVAETTTQPVASTLTRGGHPNSNAPGRRREDDENLVGHLIPQVSPTLTKHNLDSRSPQSEEQQRIVGAVHDATTSVRRLTPVECERLMGLPDGWTAPEGVKAPDSKRYAACGDAIVTTVAFWIADRIRMIEEEEAS
jgi:site-specific DNA-cytosine methylase